MFTKNGHYSQVIGKNHLVTPYDLTVTSDNHLLVADWGHNCIHEFTLEGLHLHKLASKDQLNRPYSITTDVNGCFLVTDCSHRVFIYDRNDKLLHCLGYKGSGAGQFLYPISIACSSTGALYVSDRDNHRVQKLHV